MNATAQIISDMSNPIWRLDNLYRVLDDEGSEVQFKLREEQTQYLRELHNRNDILKARQLGFCLDPETRVLTADLKWVRIDSLKPGDEIVAVDEFPKEKGKGQARKMRTATVQATRVSPGVAYRIRFDDGRSVVCTGQHPWLTKKGSQIHTWRAIETIDRLKSKGRIKVGTQVRWITDTWGKPDYEDGWFAGMLDGEGSMAKHNSSAGINVSQVDGPVWDRVWRYVTEKRYNATIERDLRKAGDSSKLGSKIVNKACFGRMDEMFRLIGLARPSRFMGRRWWEGRELPGKKTGAGWATVVSIEKLGHQPMIDLQTSTGTFIAEGFVSHNTTLISLLQLDQCLFNTFFRAATITETGPKASAILRNKVGYAYDQLPSAMRRDLPIKDRNNSRIEWEHGSAYSAGTSYRGDTLQSLHVSEYGKISAKFPEKAREIKTGSFAAVTLRTGIIHLESTAEGEGGEFYDITIKALDKQRARQELTRSDFKLHFFPWMRKTANRLDDRETAIVPISRSEHDYFNKIEKTTGYKISQNMRAWYVKEREIHEGDMKREHPATPEEAFEAAIEGAILAKELEILDKMGRIGQFPWVPQLPVHTCWDIRGTTAIWCFQRVNGLNRFVHYMEDVNMGYGHFVNELNKLGYTWGMHLLPHDGKTRIQGEHVQKPIDIIESLGFRRPEIVPRVAAKAQGVNMLKSFLLECEIDAEGCKDGLRMLRNYRKVWDDKKGKFVDEPFDNFAAHGSDAIRMAAQYGEIPTHETTPFSMMTLNGPVPYGQQFPNEFTVMDETVGF